MRSDDLRAIVAQAPREDLPGLIGDLAAAQAEALARLTGWASRNEGEGPVADLEMLTPSQVAELLKVKPSHVYDKIRRGELPAVKTGKYVRVPASALARMLRQRTRGAYTST